MDVLVLEDEWLIAEELKTQIEELGHEVLGPAMTCSAALEILWRKRPDLAVLDTRLGSETCEVVLDECVRQGVPVIISSGHAVTQMPAFAGGLPVLPKPYSMDALADALKGAAG
jgi:DNA-binding response OmpR family regulator